MSREKEKRRDFVVRATRNLLDVPDDAQNDEIREALEAIGLNVDSAVERVTQFVKKYPKQLLEEAKAEHESDKEEFELFQNQFADVPNEQIKEQIWSILEQQPPDTFPELRAHYRDLSEATEADDKTELLDMLWQLQRN